MVSVPVEPRECCRRRTVGPGLPLDPALKGEACARNSRQYALGLSAGSANHDAPEMETFGVYAGSPPGGREERTVGGYFPPDAAVDYWEE